MAVGKAIVKPMMRALGDTPVHIRQLAAMFRKHRRKQKDNETETRDLDRTDVPEALQNGWKEDSWYTPDRVVEGGRQNRPYPAEYLDNDYITQHLDHFQDGATRFYRADSLTTYGPGNHGTTFVLPTSEVDGIIAQAGGDPARLSQMLGLGDNFFFDDLGNPVDIVRADFSFDDLMNGNLRIPRGTEAGANANWIPGGYLPEGIPEAVFNIDDIGIGSYDFFAP